MKILICTDSFKGSISSQDAALAIARGWKSQRREDLIELIPFADGGEGTLAAISVASPSPRLMSKDFDHQGDPIQWLKIDSKKAVVELARLCGIEIVGTTDPLGASSYRLGLGIKAAIEDGASEILVALGGSASTDGGAGALQALGVRFVTKTGAEVKPGNAGLAQIAALDLTGINIPEGVSIRALTDVSNPLLGASGAVKVFAPQKGARLSDLDLMEDNLRHFASLFPNLDPNTKGAGAAGGCAFGLMAVGAKISLGSQFLAELIGLKEKIAVSDLVITGEGSFDSQSKSGKAVSIVSAISEKASKPCCLIAGQIRGDTKGFAQSIQLVDLAESVTDAIENPTKYLEIAGSELAKRQRL